MNVKTPIYDFITNYLKAQNIPFHMPGHKGNALYRRFGYDNFLDQMIDYDITELPGADNLFQAESIIKQAQDRYAQLYGTDKCYLLINGSSGGNIAAILASVKRGGKLIMARNCHKSVFNALTLGDIEPVYAYPEIIEEYQITGEVNPSDIEQLILENPDSEAVFITSPNYYGICSDVQSIASIAHKHNKILIVDEAHGAHLRFTDALPLSAIEAGADLVINSIHKTLASFTQSALLSLNSSLVDPYLLEDKLQCIESTSPSYLLMTSLDINASILEEHGELLMNEWIGNLSRFYERISNIPGLKTLGKHRGHDWTKINISMSDLGLSGSELELLLIENYSIYMELVTGDLVMGLTGIGNTSEDYDKLASALEDISEKRIAQGYTPIKSGTSRIISKEGAPLVVPKQAKLVGIPKAKRTVKLSESEGLICASSIIPYPPGIPLICPGERIESDSIEYIQALRAAGEKVIGVNQQGEIIVGE